jgi:WD40 repeat protein/serine/threonine protein kinase
MSSAEPRFLAEKGETPYPSPLGPLSAEQLAALLEASPAASISWSASGLPRPGASAEDTTELPGDKSSRSATLTSLRLVVREPRAQRAAKEAAKEAARASLPLPADASFSGPALAADDSAPNPLLADQSDSSAITADDSFSGAAALEAYREDLDEDSDSGSALPRPSLPSDASDSNPSTAFPMIAASEATKTGGPEDLSGPRPDSDPVARRRKLLRAGARRLPVLRAADKTSGKTGEQPSADFILKQPIGRGGQAQVWRSIQTSLAREVAVKRLIAPDSESVVEFLQEAYTTAELDHPNIVPVYDLGRIEENGAETPLLAMKLARGQAWNQLIKDDRARDDFVLEDFLAKHLPILMAVCNAVAYAHSKGIIHRDLKPHQVMVGEFGEVFLMDWGLAVSLRQAGGPVLSREGFPKRRALSAASNCCGTPAYMAPEQTLESTERLGLATDIYLLGAILFELASGQAPHWEDNAQAAFHRAMLNEIGALPENCPAELRDLLKRALATDPAQRPAGAREFRDALEGYLNGSSRRRESRQLAEEVVQAYAQELEPGYRELTERLAKLDRARALWPENPDLEYLRERLLEEFAEMALESGDLALADAQANRLEKNPRKIHLLARIRLLERSRRRRERQHRILLGAVVAILGCLALLGIVAEGQRRRALEEATSARQSEYLSNMQFARICLADGRADRARRYLVQAPDDLRHWEWGYLMRRCQMEEASRFFLGGASTAEFSPDANKLVLAALDSGEIALWDSREQTEKRLAFPGGDWIRDARFSLKGSAVAAAGRSGVAVWEASPGALVGSSAPWGEPRLLTLGAGVPSAARAVAWGPNGRLLAAALENGQTAIWRWDANEPSIMGPGELLPEKILPQRIFDGPGAPASSVALGREGRSLAAGFEDGTARVWNLDFDAPSTEPLILRSRGRTIRSVRFDPAGTLLAAAVDDGTVQLWRAADGTLSATLAGHADAVWSAEFNPSGEWLATASADGMLKLWEVSSGRELACVDAGGASGLRSARFDLDGQKLAAVSADGRVRVWNAFLMAKSRATLSARGSGPMRDADFSPDRNWTAAALSDGTIRLWAAADSRRESRLFGSRGEAPIASVRFSPDGQTLLSASLDGRATLWNSLSGRKVRELRGHGGPVNEATFSPSGSRAATASDDGSVRVWNAESGELLLEIAIPGGSAARGVAFNADGSRLATASDDGVARVWDGARGELLLEIGGHRAGLASVAFGRGSSLLATASDDGTAKLWDARSGAWLRTLEGHSGPVASVAFSPNGLRVATASDDGTARIWDALSGRELASLRGHLDAVETARFSPDGKRVVTCGRDGRVVAWEAASF